MKNILDRIKKEFFKVLPAFFFFLTMFYILVITISLSLKQYGITIHAYTVAIIGALIMAKTILIADKIKFLNAYPSRPLVWNILLKTILFAIVASLFFIVEGVIRHAHMYGSIEKALESFSRDFIWNVFWIREIWIVVLLLFYCSASELTKVFGADKIKHILFGNRKV